MRTFRNPQGPGGHDVIIPSETGDVVIGPGEQASVDLPDWQPCPDLLEEVGALAAPFTRTPTGLPAPASAVPTVAPEPTPEEHE